MVRIRCRVLMLVCLFQVTGCGGGGAGVNPIVPKYTKAVISFSLLSSQRLPFRMTGVLMTGVLPAGLSVTTGASSDPKMITGGLSAGSSVAGGVTSQFPVFGRYSAPKFLITVADSTQAQVGFGPGEIVQLTCGLTDGATISGSDKFIIERSITFNASGYNPTATVNPSSLNSYLRPNVSVTLLP